MKRSPGVLYDVLPSPPTPWIVHPRDYAVLLEVGEAHGFLPSSTIPRERDAYPLPALDVLGTPPRPVLIDNVLAAAAAECEPAQTWQERAWAEFTGHREAYVPNARPHYVVDPWAQTIADVFDVPVDLLRSAGTYENAADDKRREVIGRLGGTTVVVDHDLTALPGAIPAWDRTALVTAMSAEDARIVDALTPPTAAERAAAKAAREDLARRRLADEARQVAETVAFVRQLDAVGEDNPGLQPVIDLHAPHAPNHGAPWTWIVCNGCDWGAYAEEPPDWPCTTITTIAEHHGITVPERVRLLKEPTSV